MPRYFHRAIFYRLLILCSGFYGLLSLCSGFALAETSDPFNTAAILPAKPALHSDSTLGDQTPCP
jgi:hypothetical protein